MISRRTFFSGLLASTVAVAASPEAHAGNFFEWLEKKNKAKNKLKKVVNKGGAAKQKVAAKKSQNIFSKQKSRGYKGAEEVAFSTWEKPGTIIIKTSERALYHVLGSGRAMKYGVAVGKEGFSWSGVAKVGMKRENPTWTPPPEMIERSPQYAQWKDGMPGGLPINPLGPRALYLFNKGGDTGFRIHGTIHPGSIGTAASSGCIRMLNAEVIKFYELVRIGTKVIVI